MFADQKARSGASPDDIVEEENIFPYPKAGKGLPLPSEQGNLSILSDDDTATFSHHWEGIRDMLQMSTDVALGPPNPLLNGVA